MATGIKRLGKGKWSVRVRVTDPRTGKRRGRWRTIEGSHAEAVAARERWRRELEAEAVAPARRAETLATYARSWLSIKLARGDWEASTQTRCATALDLHLLPAFGDYRLSAITARDITTWQAEQCKSYAPETVNGWLRVLRTLMADALRDGLIAVNAAAQVRVIRRPPKPDNAFSVDELRRYLAAWQQRYPQHYPLVLTLALTGARWGEATALKWSDVDEAIQTGVLRITRAHHLGHVKGTKTGRHRSVPFPGQLADALSEHRRRLLEAQNSGLQAGWCFSGQRGQLLSNGALSGQHRAVLARIGVTRPVTIHGLRHTMTDLLRLAQISSSMAAAVLGHESVAMHYHYSQVREDEVREAGVKVVGLLSKLGRTVGRSAITDEKRNGNGDR